MNKLQQAIALLGEAIQTLSEEKEPTMSRKAAVNNLKRAKFLSECGLGLIEKPSK